MTRHNVIKALKNSPSLPAWQQGVFLVTPICPVWSRLVLNRCEGSWGSTGGWVGCHKESELYPSSARVCVFVCVFVHMLRSHACACICFFPLNRSCQQKCWISGSFAALPAPKEAHDTWPPRQQHTRRHRTRVFLVLMPDLANVGPLEKAFSVASLESVIIHHGSSCIPLTWGPPVISPPSSIHIRGV